MPIFEYACDDCGTKFEKLVRRSAEESVRCPSCGQDHLSPQYSTFATKASSRRDECCNPDMGCASGNSMCQGGMCGMNMN